VLLFIVAVALRIAQADCTTEVMTLNVPGGPPVETEPIRGMIDGSAEESSCEELLWR
jgi:hypothetical protein